MDGHVPGEVIVSLVVAVASVVFSSGALWMRVKDLRTLVDDLKECVNGMTVSVAKVGVRVDHLERERDRLQTPVLGVPVPKNG